MAIDNNFITILGHTAAGKTQVATKLAYNLNTEIISADSRQVYKMMNIGTGKDLSDYIVNGNKIKHHLIDIKEPGYKYNVYEFQKDFLIAYNYLLKQKKTPILCGGSGMYIESILKGYKLIDVPINNSLRQKLINLDLFELQKILSTYKQQHNKSDIDNPKRTIRAIEIAKFYNNNKDIDFSFPKINSLIIGIYFDRLSRRDRIRKRLKQRLDEGMIDEVKTLLNSGISSENLIYYGLEYKFVTKYLNNKISYKEMFDGLKIAIYQFAKRQMTWFRKMERNGFKINWLNGEIPNDEKIEKIVNLFKIHTQSNK